VFDKWLLCNFSSDYDDAELNHLELLCAARGLPVEDGDEVADLRMWVLRSDFSNYYQNVSHAPHYQATTPNSDARSDFAHDRVRIESRLRYYELDVGR
jgi:hypothetical protein